MERALAASDAERRPIAATLHDGVVQQLVAASFIAAGQAQHAAADALEVADDGRGFDGRGFDGTGAAGEGHFGLRLMTAAATTAVGSSTCSARPASARASAIRRVRSDPGARRRRPPAGPGRPAQRAGEAGPAARRSGPANKQIARRLGISESTVKVHIGNIFRHIGVRDRTSAALWARENLPDPA